MIPVLVLIRPLDLYTGQRIELRIGSAAEATALGLDGKVWEPALVRRPRIAQDLMSPDLDGRFKLATADMIIGLGLIREFQYTERLHFPGAPVIIYRATDLAMSRSPVEFAGIVSTAPYDRDTRRLTINATVDRSRVDKPLLTKEFTGGGGRNGEAAVRGALKPFGVGYNEGIEWVLFDSVNNIGMLDGYGNLQQVNRALEGASSLGVSVGDFASYEALRDAITTKAIIPGRWGTCIAEGMVGFGAPVVGRVTFDATFALNRTGAIINQILSVNAGLNGGVDTGSFALLDASVNREVRYHTTSQIQIADLIEAMALPINATPLITAQNEIAITRNTLSAPVATLMRGGVNPAVTDWQTAPPVEPTYRIIYRAARPGVVLTLDEVLYEDALIDRGLYSPTEVYRAGHLVWLDDKSQWLYQNATPSSGHAPPSGTPEDANGNVSDAWWFRRQRASSVSAVDLAYANGETFESLKPRQAGADPTGTNTAANIAGQGTFATKSYADYETEITGAGKPLTFVVVAKGAAGQLPAGAPGIGLFRGDGAAIYTAAARSYSVLSYDPIGKNWAGRSFDVYGNGEVQYNPGGPGGNNAGAMAAYLNGIASGWPVIIYTWDEPLNMRLTGGLPEAMYRCGASRSIFGRGNWTVHSAYVLIGVAGAGEGNGAERYSDGGGNTSPSSYVVTSFNMVNGVPLIAGQPLRNAADLTFTDGRGVNDLISVAYGADVTGNNQASSIRGQGQLATQSAVDWLTQVIGNLRPENGATVGAQAGINIFEGPGGAVLFLAAIKTILGTAQNIYGQGTLATQNNVSGTQVVNGRIVSANGATEIDLDGGRIIFRTNATAQVIGNPFGSANQFVEWFGPNIALSQMTEANADSYKKTNREMYTSGRIISGALGTSKATADTTPAANVTVNTGTNGGIRYLNLSYGYTRQRSVRPGGGGSVSGTPSATIYLRQNDANGQVLAILDVNNGYTEADPANGGDPGFIMETMSGALTFTDNTGGAGTVQFYAHIVSRTNATFNGTSNGPDQIMQRLSITTSEG